MRLQKSGIDVVFELDEGIALILRVVVRRVWRLGPVDR